MTPDIKARLREVEHWLRALPNSQGAWADDVQDALATIEALEEQVATLTADVNARAVYYYNADAQALRARVRVLEDELRKWREEAPSAI